MRSLPYYQISNITGPANLHDVLSDFIFIDTVIFICPFISTY